MESSAREGEWEQRQILTLIPHSNGHPNYAIVLGPLRCRYVSLLTHCVCFWVDEEKSQHLVPYRAIWMDIDGSILTFPRHGRNWKLEVELALFGAAFPFEYCEAY